MQPVWRNFAPMYIQGLSHSHLFAGDTVFVSGDAPLSARDPQPLHWHDAYEFGFVMSGTGSIVLGGREYPFVPGQVYIINDCEPHMGYTDDEAVLFVVHFHPCILESGWIGQMRQEARAPFLPHFGQDGPLLPLDHSTTTLVRAILENIRTEVMHYQPLWDVAVCGQVLHAVGLLAREALRAGRPTPEELARRRALKTVQPVLALLHERYTEALSLDDLASAAGLSPSYCCELFSKALRTSPIAYRNALRLAEARRLSQQTNMTMRAIAYQVGFQSVQELNRLLRREASTYKQPLQAEPKSAESL